MFSAKLHPSWGEWETKKKCFNEYILHFIYQFVLYANYLKGPTAGKGAIHPCKLAILESAGKKQNKKSQCKYKKSKFFKSPGKKVFAIHFCNKFRPKFFSPQKPTFDLTWYAWIILELWFAWIIVSPMSRALDCSGI